MRDLDGVRKLTEQQHGLVSRQQLTELGYSRRAVAHAITSRRLERLSNRVLRLVGSPSTFGQRSVAACLELPGGGVVALHSAAAMWGLPGFTAEPFHVIGSRRPHRGGAELGRQHSTTTWLPGDATSIDHVPVTTPVRTLRDLAGRIHSERLAQTCDRMLAKRLSTSTSCTHWARTSPSGRERTAPSR